jgi:putative endonuclease
MQNKELGALGEKIACRQLKRAGYKIVAANYRSPLGEIDLIARKKGCLVFVEVKCRHGNDFGVPEEAVTAAKRRKLIQVAEYYIQHESPKECDWRIDVVAVELDARDHQQRIAIIENAVLQDE